jgi:hypothetical protein
MNGKSPTILNRSSVRPEVSKDERSIIQPNRLAIPLKLFTDGQIS